MERNGEQWGGMERNGEECGEMQTGLERTADIDPKPRWDHFRILEQGALRSVHI